MVTSPNGLTAKLFGHWIRVDHSGCLGFINTPIEDDQRKWVVAIQSNSGDLARISREENLENLGNMGRQKEQSREINDEGQTYTKMEYLKFKEICPELNSLELTLLRQEVCREETLQSVVMEKVRKPNFEIQHLGEWAAGLLKEFGVKKDIERKALDRLDPD